MIQLPNLEKDPKDTADLCKCRPICKNRRREWKGTIQKTSAELLLERKPKPECVRRCPTKVQPFGPCPLFGRSRRLVIKERKAVHHPHVVTICRTPIDVSIDTPYLNYTEIAKRLGAWDSVKACCAFCSCGACCSCGSREYVPRDAERTTKRRSDMRDFDARVKAECVHMRVMYDKP